MSTKYDDGSKKQTKKSMFNFRCMARSDSNSSMSSNSSWSSYKSNDMQGMSRYPSPASDSMSQASTVSPQDVSMSSSSDRSFSSRSSSRSSSSYGARDANEFYASHSIYINNISSPSNNSLQELDRLHMDKK